MARGPNRRHGALKDRFHFQARGAADDGYGLPLPGAGAFVTQFTVDVGLDARRGNETVIASRLTGVQPYYVTMRWSLAGLRVSNGWQLLDARAPRTRKLNVVSVPVDPDGSRQWLEFVATEGVPS